MTDSYSGCNLHKEILSVTHSQMKPVGDSPFRVACPVCKKGFLLVARNPDTLELSEHDCCILCAQQVKYLDIENLRSREKTV